MSLPSRLLTCALVVATAVSLVPAHAAAADDSPVATSSLEALVRADLPDGVPGLIGATATQEFHGTPVEDQFLGAAVLEHDALADTWAHGGELGGWLAPEHDQPAQTFKPELNLNESLLFESTYDDGPTVGAGDRAGFNLGVVPYTAPVPWSRQRGEATGTLGWSATTLSQQTSSRFGSLSGDLETFMFRADVVATGGDVDARERSVQLPPLVLDLPRSYDSNTRYIGVAGVVSPYTNYFASFNFAALPEAGKAIVRAEITGYIPEGRTVTLPNGSTMNEWHLPLTGTISFATAGEGEPAASLELPGGGVAMDLSSRKIVPLDAGDTLIATTEGAHAASDEPAGVAASASPVMEDALQTSKLERSSTQPVDLRLNSEFSLTVHPDYQGIGLLALEGVRSDRLRRRYADLVTIPAVRVEGQDVMLTRDKLLGLRALPFRDGGGIRVTPSARFADGGLNQSVSTSTRIFRGGFLLDALYRLDDDILVKIQHQLFHQGTPDGGRLNTTVEAFALDGRPVDAYPLGSALLGGGDVSAGGSAVLTEGVLPSTRTLNVDDQRIDANFRSGFGVLRAGTTTVLEQPAPLLGRDADPATEITGVPLALAIAPPATSAPARNTRSTLRFGLVDTNEPAADPPALGEACHGVQITDDIVPDAPPSHDIQAAWFEADATNLYVSMQAADLPAAGFPVPVRYATNFWSDHEHYAVEALQQNGEWIFQTGFAAGGFRIPVEGEVVTGAGGIVRVTVPLYTFDLNDGDWLRDAATHSFAVGARPLDSAPRGSSMFFGLGDDYRVAPCKAAPQILDTLLELDPIEPAQYSDTWTVAGRLTDDSGAPLASRSVAVTLEAADGVVAERSAQTTDDGTFSVSGPATMVPGDYQVSTRFGGEDGSYTPSSATAALTILKEDSDIVMAIEGKGSSRTIAATLRQPDDSSAIAERQVSFYADGALIGEAVTDQDGRVIFELPPRYRGGHHEYETRFGGDDYYLEASARTST